jgi:hypothetical protein
MSVETVAWGLMALGVVVAALLVVLALRHVRRLARVRAAVAADVGRRVARLRLVAAGRAHGRSRTARRAA